MMDLRTIDALAREQARKAARGHVVPMYMWPEDIEMIHEAISNHVIPKLMIPNIGHHRPKGHKLVETYFVDKTGWGYESEPALTIWAFLEKVQEGKGYAIIEEGEFQVMVGEFEEVRAKTRKAA